MVMDNTSENITYRPPKPNVSYLAFVDPSGGSVDDMTLAIGHYDYEFSQAVIDKIMIAHPPFSPDKITKEFAESIKAYSEYQLASVWGDAYGGTWPQERFAKHGVSYMICPKTKSELYAELIPLLMARRCDLLDMAILKTQLASLERRTTRNGKSIMDHPTNAHDDVANVAAGCCVMVALGQVEFNIDDVVVGEPMASAHSDYLNVSVPGTAMAESYLDHIAKR